MIARPRPGLPPVVKLNFGPQRRAFPNSPRFGVELRDDGGAIIAGGPLKAVAAWLKTRGYRWVPGSNGVWSRA